MKISLTTDHESLGGIDADRYHSIALQMIRNAFGDVEIETTVAPTTNHGVRVTMDDDSDPSETEEQIADICEQAFSECCRSDL